MTKFNDEDEDLVNFLRQNRPPVPPSDPQLAQRILSQVQTIPIKKKQHSLRMWLVPFLVFAGSFTILLNEPLTTPERKMADTQNKFQELNNLEKFMEDNWHTVVSDSAHSDTFQVTEVSNQYQ
jgi:hypothetical protein